MMLERVDPEVAEMLMPEEEIILVASQSKVAPGGTLSAPNKVYITNNRVLFKDPKWFGLKANIIDIGYEDISTVMLKRGVFTTEIYLKPRFSPQKIQLPAVDKRVALQVSMLIQKGMRGELVSLRAQQKAQASGERQSSVLVRLEKLADMCEKGLLTEQEFQIMKEELMLTMKPEINFHGPSSVAKEIEIFEERPAPAPVPEILAKPEPQVEIPQKPKDHLSCRYCNYMTVPVGSKFCPECGQGIVEETNVWKMCPACDALMTGDSVYCTSCNKKFPETLS
ncbi:MAG: PH domain-containing protein [Nitrososphaera sp.]|uniref:PH domain-containing protein n=1 Tax=Nitrososphaera sp. TaxID=1971748 RepID=UPI0017F2C3F0|nr:PH domain-containing protein [Nitrososphaera sp.]NWG36055.1 PH domain-containing protein [Nitrososphaera sp.]